MKRILACLGLIVLAVAILALLDGTRGGLAYFSPDTLEYRSQREFTILGGSLPLWRSRHRTSHVPIIAAAIVNGWIRPTNRPQRWDYVFHWNGAWKGGYSPVYDVFHRGDDHILERSLADPEWAKLYWGEGFGAYQSNVESERSLGRVILSLGWRTNSAEELKRTIRMIKIERGLPLDEAPSSK